MMAYFLWDHCRSIIELSTYVYNMHYIYIYIHISIYIYTVYIQCISTYLHVLFHAWQFRDSPINQLVISYGKLQSHVGLSLKTKYSPPGGDG